MISPDLVARAVAQIRKNTANYEYFFESLSSPEWLEPLRDSGFFVAPPEPVREGKYVSFPGWPESRYLARMAAIESAAQLVYSIASKIPPTENVRVYHDLAEIALALPPGLGARFVPAAKAWIASPYQLLIPEQVGKLVHRLADHGKTRAALDLAKTLLELVPESQDHADADDRREVRAHFDVWHYEKILNEHIPALVHAAGERALSMMCELLASAVALSTRKRSADEWEDYSWIWHPAIEDHSQNSGRTAKDALVAGVRDAAEQVVRGNITVLPRVVAELESRRSVVFRRIALHLLAAFPEASGDIAEPKLTDRKLFDDLSVRHEYYRVAHASFAGLSPPAQEKLLFFIEQGPDMQQAGRWFTDALRREPSEDELVRYQRVWQLKHLSALKHALPPAWAERYLEWSTKYGEPEHPDFSAYHSSGWVGASSPRTGEELRSLSVPELTQYLNTWQPSEEWGAPSREGLGNELQALVASDPGTYVAGAQDLRSVRPIFIRAFVSGLRGAAGQGKRFDWAPVLDLFAFVAQQKEERRKATGEVPEEDPDLGWTRKAIADFVADALGHEERSPPYSMRAQVWRVLRPLTEDPDPTPEDEARYGPPNMDPFTMSLNTTRGQALHGVMNYAQWRAHHEPSSHGDAREWITGCSEVREVLEQHLAPDRDPSLAVRSVYGQQLPTLAWLDIEWVKAHLHEIFPAGAAHQELRRAAWDAFVVFCNPQSALLPLLRGEYEHAVASLARRAVLKHGRDPVERLAEHLMVLYWWGDLDLAGEGLMSRFFALATDEIREHAMDFVGRSLAGPDAPRPDVLRRLQLLWEVRLDSAKSLPEQHVEELSGFGWWFASGRFEHDWALRQLRAVVRLTKKIEPADKVIERLADWVEERPIDAVAAFQEILDADKQGWLVSLAKDDVERLLQAALARDESREAAVDALHRLGAKGHSEFRKLLR